MRDGNNRLAFVLQPGDRGFVQRYALFGNKTRRSEQGDSSIEQRLHAPAGDRGEVFNRRRGNAAILGVVDDGARQRVFGTGFQRNRHLEQGGFGSVADDNQIGNGWFSARQRAGFVEHEGVDMTSVLQRFCVFDQHTSACSRAAAHHDRGRCRETQRAGTGNHQHGNRRDQRVGE